MKSKVLSHVFLIIFFFAFSSTLIAQQSGKEIIWQSIEAIGGKEKLEKLKTVRMVSAGHTNGLEQSERPEGPWLVSYDKTTTLFDFENERFQKQVERSFIGSEDWTNIKTVINGGTGMRVFGERNIPMDHGSVEAEKDKWLMLPDRALLAAGQSEDVDLLENTMLQGVQHHVVSYNYNGQRSLLFINANTKLPTAIEVKKLSYLDIWGKVPYRTYFSYWFMQPGGLLYPYQFDTYHGNQPYETRSILNVEFNTEVEDKNFAIPEKIQKASPQATNWRSRPLGWQREPIKEIAPDVVMIPGAWYATIVKQSDGLVIIEAPISSKYSEKVISEAQKRFPNIPIKAVVNTSDAWPHLGGVRAYVARGIPVYTHRLNKKVLNKLIDADYQYRPDSLEKNPVRPKFREITGKTTIGKGDNRLELYPILGEGAERMDMVYFPKQKLLYGSDLIQYGRDGNLWNIQYVSELAQAVKREKLDVEQVYAMHASPTAWDSVISELDEFMEEN